VMVHFKFVWKKYRFLESKKGNFVDVYV
jgi:hypothetical protein